MRNICGISFRDLGYMMYKCYIFCILFVVFEWELGEEVDLKVVFIGCLGTFEMIVLVSK